jgi:hypothetical protein
VSLTDRDRKIVMVLLPALLLAAYWFLLLTPKREQAAESGTELAAQVERRDAARQAVAELEGSRTDFAADYAELVRLGKAVPPTVDMPTLLVQLDGAAAGTDIEFMSIAAEEREAAPAPAPAAPPAPGSGDGSQPAAAGGAPAQSAPGGAAETAGNTVASANAGAAAAEQSGIDPADTQTSQQAREGGLPIGGGTAVPGVAESAGTSGVAGLDTVPLTLEFTGDFFDLAAFFHRLKRYVETSRDDLYVRGRLLTVDGLDFGSSAETFPQITATLTATAYLAPKAEGPTAGATPSGPAITPASDSSAQPLATASPTAAR